MQLYLRACLLSVGFVVVFSQEYLTGAFGSYGTKEIPEFSKFESAGQYESDLDFRKGSQYQAVDIPQDLNVPKLSANVDFLSGSATQDKFIGAHSFGQEEMKMAQGKEMYGYLTAGKDKFNPLKAELQYGTQAFGGGKGGKLGSKFSQYNIDASIESGLSQTEIEAAIAKGKAMAAFGAQAGHTGSFDIEVQKHKGEYMTGASASGGKYKASSMIPSHKMHHIHEIKGSIMSASGVPVAISPRVLVPVSVAQPVIPVSGVAVPMKSMGFAKVIGAGVAEGIASQGIASAEFMKGSVSYEAEKALLQKETLKKKKVSVGVPLKKPVFYTYAKKVNIAVPYTKPVIIPIPKKVPYPVEYEQPTVVPVKKTVKYVIPKYKPVPVPIEKYFPVPVIVKKPFRVPVAKPVPVPHVVEKPYPVAVNKHVPFHVPNYKAVVIPIDKYVKIPIPKYKPLPVTVNKYIPVKIPKFRQIPIYVTKNIPMPVTRYKPVPYIVNKYVPTPYQVVRKVPVPIVKKVLVPFNVYKKYPVPIKRYIPVVRTIVRYVPVPVVKNVPYYKVYKRPVAVPIHRKIPVPVPVYTRQYIPVVKIVKSFVPINRYVQVPIERTIHVPVNVNRIIRYPVERRIPIPVQYNRFIPIPTPRIVGVPYHYPKPVPIPVLKHVRFPYPILRGVSTIVPSYGISSMSGIAAKSLHLQSSSFPVPPLPFTYGSILSPRSGAYAQAQSVRLSQAGLLTPSVSSYGFGIGAAMPKQKSVLETSAGSLSYELSAALSSGGMKNAGMGLGTSLNAFGAVAPISSAHLSSSIISPSKIISPVGYNQEYQSSFGSFESSGAASISNQMPLSSAHTLFKRSLRNGSGMKHRS